MFEKPEKSRNLNKTTGVMNGFDYIIKSRNTYSFIFPFSVTIKVCGIDMWWKPIVKKYSEKTIKLLDDITKNISLSSQILSKFHLTNFHSGWNMLICLIIFLSKKTTFMNANLYRKYVCIWHHIVWRQNIKSEYQISLISSAGTGRIA